MQRNWRPTTNGFPDEAHREDIPENRQLRDGGRRRPSRVRAPAVQSVSARTSARRLPELVRETHPNKANRTEEEKLICPEVKTLLSLV